MAEGRKIRPLTAAESGDVATRWIRRIRRNVCLEGGVAIILAILASGHKPKLFILIAAVLALISLISLRSLNLIAHDLSAGAAEEILGSVQKREGIILGAIPALLGPVNALAGEFVITLLRRVAFSRGKFVI